MRSNKPIENVMDDIQILNEERKIYYIGPDKKKLELRMLGISDYYDVFVPEFLFFLDYFRSDTEKIVLPTGKGWTKKKEMETLRSQLKRVFSYKIVQKRFVRILKRTGYLKFRKRYFYKHVTPIMMIEMFEKIYKFNVDDFKKKVLVVATRIVESSRHLQTYTALSSTAVGLSQSQKKTGQKTGLPKMLKPRFRSPGK